MVWLRLYDDILDDPKVQMLSDKAFRMFINCLALAKRGNGKITGDINQLAFSLRLAANKTAETFQILLSAHLIDRNDDGTFSPHNWNGRQYESDSAAERMRRHRAKVRDEQLRNAQRNSDAIDTDSEPDTEQIQKKGVVDARALLNRVCEILGVDLQADPSRITWLRQVEVMLQDGIPEKDVLAGAEVARANAVLSIPYIRAVALKVRNTKETNVNGRPKRESIQDAWIRTGAELAQEFAARDGTGDRHAPNGSGPKLLETGHGAGRSQGAVEAVLRRSVGKV